MNLTPGMRFGPYEIGPALGSGGMGEVWKAHDPRLGRDVAIKCLRQDLATQRIQVHRFEREARAASSLNHPNIITIYEIGEWNGQPFIAMEFVEGQRLRDVLAEGTLPLDRGLRIASEMAEALAAAHARGIVHRDLKPENVMLTRDGRVKVLDFGLAKPEDPTHDAGATDAVTLPGLVVGTAGYMAPEQARGAGADFRSDQFSLGAVLYEIFGGRSPFRRGSTMETISAILHDEPPPLVELDPLIPPQLAGIVQRCLSKAPADRYGSTADLAHDLRQLRASLTPTSRGSAFHAAPVRPASRRRAAVWATVLVAVLAVTGVWVFRNVPRQKATDALQQGAAAIPASETLPREKVVAILPFKEVTGEKEWRLIGEGMAEAVSVRLHQVAGAQIIPPSALGGLAERQNVQAVAREFGANLVLTTTLWRSSGQIRASYSLLNPAGRQIASGTVHGTIGNLFDFGDLIAERIAGSLELPRLPVPNRGGLRTAEVQDRFFQAVGAMHRYDDPASVDFAIALLEPMAEANPESALLHAALGRAYRAKYALTSDSAWAERAIETSRRAARLDRSLPEVHVTLGQLLIMTGRFDDAAAELRQALAMRPDDPEAMLWLGQALDQAGESDEAESTYRAAIALRPTYWAGYNKLGIFYLLRGRFDDAIRMLSEVARLTPDNHRGLSNLGAAQMFSGDFESAAASFQRAIEVAPAAPGFSNLGTCLYYLHRFDEARAAFEKAVELAPADFRLWLNLADAYRWTGQPDEEREARDKGIELARRSLEINPNDPATHGQLVLSYALLGSEAQARRHLDRALSLAPDNPNVLIKAAILAEWEGDSAKALDWITRAVAAGYSKPMLANDPELRDLRGHPSFQKLIAPS